MNTLLRYIKVNDWHLRRISALLAGLFLAVQAILHSEALSGILSVIFLFQAVTNTGCFGRSNCSVSYTDNSQKSDSLDLDTTEYEEIK